MEHTIGKAAERAGLPVSTVRYYERRGLLLPRRRGGGRYRVYTEEDIERLRFIRAAQATGFTLDDVGILLQFIKEEDAPCGDVRALIEARLGTVRDRLADLRRLQESLEHALDRCRVSAPDEACKVVEELRSKGKKGAL